MRRIVHELMTICEACCTVCTMRQDYTRSGTRMLAGEPMRYTGLVDVLDAETLRCNVCQWRCELKPRQAGRCNVRVRDDNGLAVHNDGLISAATVGPIDEHRLWHFFPGTQVLTLGGWGYAFPEDGHRSQYGSVPLDEQHRRRLAPERAATFALERLCRGIVWGHSDPSVAHEYVFDLLRTARATSRYTALITSGFLTMEALDQIGHYLDGICLELRAFDDAAYRRLTGVEHWRGILEVAEHAFHRWHCHIEVVTRLHPGVNDTADQIHELARWIRSTLSPFTPWHVLPGDAGAAAAAAVARARRTGAEAGLFYVYGPEPGQETICPSCASVVIERSGRIARMTGVQDGRCTCCGADLHLRTSIFKRS
jgi:pyruvate formate lyase activating enzyme